MDQATHRRVGIWRSETPAYERRDIEMGIEAVLAEIGLGGGAGLAGADDEDKGLLASLIVPGDTVLLKPNMVRQCDRATGGWEHVITHGEVVRAVAVLAARALQGRGRIVIADGPHPGSDFAATAAAMRLEEIQAEVRRRFALEVEVVDLSEEAPGCGEEGAERWWASGDPRGYVDFDLGERSEFSGYEACDRLRGGMGDAQKARSAHTGGRHCYRVAATALTADVFINLPKMKTHPKTGVTLSLKNLVGVHGDRYCLPHYTDGSRRHGGDESPAAGRRAALRAHVVRWAKKCLGRWITAGGRSESMLRRAGSIALGQPEERIGNWHGNDTTWRMVLDLNKILLFGRPDGSLGTDVRKGYLTIVDGVIAGERDGPVSPDPKPAGLLVAGLNPVAVDTACATLMGFDPARLKVVSQAWKCAESPLVGFEAGEVECRSNVREWNVGLDGLASAPHCGFAPHSGWQGHIERT